MPIDSAVNAITVSMPFTVDISGLEAQLFGAAVSLCGEVIACTEALDVSKFYTNDASCGWIMYLQGVSEDTFKAYINTNMAAGVRTEFEDGVRLASGETYDLSVKGAAGLDMTDTTLGWTAPYNKFYSLEDFVLSYMANKIFGHPGALAPIKNDSSLRTSIKNKYHSGLEVVYGLSGETSLDLTQGWLNTNNADASGLPAAITALLGSSTGGVDNGINMNGLTAIVQQVMNLDPARFSEDNKGKLVALQFIATDKIRLQIRLRGNTYKLYGTDLVAGSTSAQDTVTTEHAYASTTPATQLNDDVYYVLEFTMASVV